MGSRRTIYNDIAASTSVFCSRQKKNPRAGPWPWEFFGLGREKLDFGAILLYISLRVPIYTLHISQLYSAQKCFFFAQNPPIIQSVEIQNIQA